MIHKRIDQNQVNIFMTNPAMFCRSTISYKLSNSIEIMHNLGIETAIN